MVMSGRPLNICCKWLVSVTKGILDVKLTMFTPEIPFDFMCYSIVPGDKLLEEYFIIIF